VIYICQKSDTKEKGKKERHRVIYTIFIKVQNMGICIYSKPEVNMKWWHLPLPVLGVVVCKLPISSILNVVSVSKEVRARFNSQEVWAEKFQYVCSSSMRGEK
jgi:hypothetical protein